MDVQQIFIIITTVIGSATLIFRGLEGLAKLTKTEKDDHFVAKGLYYLQKISEYLALNKKN